MGHERHEATLIVTSEYDQTGLGEALTEFRAGLPEAWRRLLVGPVTAVQNGFQTWIWCPDGSKEGWADSEQGDVLTAELWGIIRGHRYGDGSGAHAVQVLVYDDWDPPAVLHMADDLILHD